MDLIPVDGFVAGDPSVTVVESLNASALEVYYIRSHESWASLVPYHPILGIYVFLSNKFALYAWNYMDITIALLSRALYQKFKVLCKQGEALLVAGGDGYGNLYNFHFQTSAVRKTINVCLKQMLKNGRSSQRTTRHYAPCFSKSVPSFRP